MPLNHRAVIFHFSRMKYTRESKLMLLLSEEEEEEEKKAVYF